ncbi:MAG: hypothetical protein PHS53_03365 [Candidatus Pacebacteria bacterium]|nr:hypothetical protein [Candidatus Paceibacterota bacterium]MDD5357155.1 hypothetical protein [Candidatus Paceibacterota bacterium]
MQIQQRENRIVKFFTVDKGTSVVIYAVAFRKEGSELIAVSEPRIVRIIAKEQVVLKGEVSSGNFSLPGKISTSVRRLTKTLPVISPFFETSIFQTGFIATIGARAPSN